MNSEMEIKISGVKICHFSLPHKKIFDQHFNDLHELQKMRTSFFPLLLVVVLAPAAALISSSALPTNPRLPLIGWLNNNNLMPTSSSARNGCATLRRSLPIVKSSAAAAAVAFPSPDENNNNGDVVGVGVRDVETQLPGIYGPKAKSKYVVDFDWLIKGSLRQRIVAALRFFFMGGLLDFFRSMRVTYGRKIPVTVYDARAKEKREGLSKSEFFDKYGFVILDSKVQMSADDWEKSDRDLGAEIKAVNKRHIDDDDYKKVMNEFRNGDTPVKRIYTKEADTLIRSILPRATTVMPPAKGIRRYITKNPNKAPATTVHNDYGLSFDDIVKNQPYFDFGSQKAKYDETNSSEYMLVNLWRPILPMSEPCRSKPLCFLDSSTLSSNDFVTLDMKSQGEITQLKENPKHKFYYYPDMTTNEVVVFKQFHQVRNESIARMPVFHTAFADPAANKDTEGRVSFEYRVGVLC